MLVDILEITAAVLLNELMCIDKRCWMSSCS